MKMFKVGSCDCPKVSYIWYDGVQPDWTCRDCGLGITWREEEWE